MMGKGWTGSLVCCLLFFLYDFVNIEAANDYYKKKWFVNVTNPSQLRYIKYIQKFYNQGSNKLAYTDFIIKKC